MSAVAAAALVACMGAGWQDDLAAVEAARLAGDFGKALELLDTGSFEDAPGADRARFNILYTAGDMPGAYAAGEAALQSDPDNPWTVWLFQSLAAQLGAPEPKGASPQDLLRLAEEAPGLAQETRDFYAAQARELEENDVLTGARHAKRNTALGRARWAVVMTALGCAAALAWLARRGPARA